MSTYYHGTCAHLRPGDLITPGREAIFSNSRPRRVYCTTSPVWALVYAELGKVSAELGLVPAVSQQLWHLYVYEVTPQARHLHRDPSGFAGTSDLGARWSGRPLRVVRELPITRPLARQALALAKRMDPS